MDFLLVLLDKILSIIHRGRFLQLKHYHELLLSIKVHASRIQQFNHLWRVGNFDHFINLFPYDCCGRDGLERLVSVVILSV